MQSITAISSNEIRLSVMSIQKSDNFAVLKRSFPNVLMLYFEVDKTKIVNFIGETLTTTIFSKFNDVQTWKYILYCMGKNTSW